MKRRFIILSGPLRTFLSYSHIMQGRPQSNRIVNISANVPLGRLEAQLHTRTIIAITCVLVG